MRCWMCAWLLAMAMPGSIAAAVGPTASADSKGALIALEQKWVAALERSDIATLSTIWAKTFVDTDETGHRSDKAEVFSILKSGALRIRKLQLSEMKVYAYGDAAVVTGASVQDGDFQGQALAKKIVFTDTFVRRGGEWIAVASQRTTSQ
jgi:ketosteroid isomerase-like protein